ncbi:DUF3380 domain-containing protein [Phormidium tenue FACHB-1052]|uniref:N-acetylmuramidase domain-containing protein n=1 Tax=Phormidium tenue NIES-30 TaxID=549789 RepID=A0A1U7IXU1_9CYAN|nr:DUF3380 domain-containing protein [Phormidium tenue FACHB-1052]OKH43154.1 hypothetical protein NIES30_25545 [Phormidium tenue NIES-30]
MAGYSNVQSFVKDMYESESKHLLAMVNFIKLNKADTALKTLNWEMFVEIYNGGSYRLNRYRIKLTKAYQEYSALDKLWLPYLP